MVFHHMVLIFHSFKDLSNLPLIFSVFKSFERFWRYRFFRSGRLQDSLLTEPSPILPFIIDLKVLVFNQMVLIFHLNMYFVCSIKVFQI
uniref:Uncharacterized protein n=1 Tax=Brassica oleracea var. oleracea TaxID=109376 RepID=A0A0D3DMD3_BRAOL